MTINLPRLGKMLLGRKFLLYALGIVVAYVLDAWLGSFALIFRNWKLMLRCFSNPLLAAIVVPRQGSLLIWFLMNLLVLGALAAIFFHVIRHYPEFYQRLSRKKDPDISDDPTCGTSHWMTRKEAGENFDFGIGPGIVLGRFDGDFIRHNCKNPMLNKNCLVIGPPKTGKTWSLVLPNILQSIASGESAIITDPKMEILRKTVSLFQQHGYVVRVFNLKDLLNSDRINFISEVRDDLDAFVLTEIIMRNTAGAEHRAGGDAFWERAEQNLLTALIQYTASTEMPPEYRSLPGLYDFLTGGDFAKLDASFKCLPDDHPSKGPYNLFLMSNPKTRGDILAGLGTRFKIFQNKVVRQLTSANDIDLELPGRQKCAYFCVVPDDDRTFQCLSAMFFSFLFLRLTRQGDRFPNGENPVPVNFIMDEFCTIGAIQGFNDRIASMRSRNINCMMVAHSTPQLKEKYPLDTWKEIIGCCSLRLVWGSAELDTSKYISDMLGPATVETTSVRKRYMEMEAAQLNMTTKARPLLDPSEVGRIPLDEGIALVVGTNAIRFKKTAYTDHPLSRSMSPTNKYVPVRDRKINAPDIQFDDGSGVYSPSVDWNGPSESDNGDDGNNKDNGNDWDDMAVK